MAGRGDRTREHLLDVAEQLFGTEGIAHVSLRQIRIAAGQRNEGAVQYHFGDRNGVLAAIAERHGPRVQAIQDHILAGAGPRPSLRRLVDALVRPLADYGERGASERAWIRILAQLLTDTRLSLATLHEQAPPRAAAVGEAIHAHLCTRLPPDVAASRLWAVSQFTVHIVADRARLLDDPDPARPLPAHDAFTANLVAMAHGALRAPAAPVSPSPGSVSSPG